MTKNKEQDELSKVFLESLDKDVPFGLNEDIKMLIVKCLDCSEEDEVPEYVVEEFHFDLKENEEVKVVCPFCNGTMRSARNIPSELASLGMWFKSRQRFCSLFLTVKVIALLLPYRFF